MSALDEACLMWGLGPQLELGQRLGMVLQGQLFSGSIIVAVRKTIKDNLNATNMARGFALQNYHDTANVSGANNGSNNSRNSGGNKRKSGRSNRNNGGGKSSRNDPVTRALLREMDSPGSKIYVPKGWCKYFFGPPPLGQCTKTPCIWSHEKWTSADATAAKAKLGFKG